MFHQIYSICVHCILDSQEMIVQMTKKQPKKSAAFGGRLLVLFWVLKYNHFLRVQDKYIHILSISDGTYFFELQLCIEILLFKEKSNLGYTDHPEITTSLYG